MIHPDLMKILRCPACAKTDKGVLECYKDRWLICEDCGRKYPIAGDIPVMLIDEGSKWMDTAADQLPLTDPLG